VTVVNLHGRRFYGAFDPIAGIYGRIGSTLREMTRHTQPDVTRPSLEH
jgi:hypothetical protein